MGAPIIEIEHDPVAFQASVLSEFFHIIYGFASSFVQAQATQVTITIKGKKGWTKSKAQKIPVSEDR
jgi:hypothetical protein